MTDEKFESLIYDRVQVLVYLCLANQRLGKLSIPNILNDLTIKEYTREIIRLAKEYKQST